MVRKNQHQYYRRVLLRIYELTGDYPFCIRLYWRRNENSVCTRVLLFVLDSGHRVTRISVEGCIAQFEFPRDNGFRESRVRSGRLNDIDLEVRLDVFARMLISISGDALLHKPNCFRLRTGLN